MAKRQITHTLTAGQLEREAVEKGHFNRRHVLSLACWGLIESAIPSVRGWAKNTSDTTVDKNAMKMLQHFLTDVSTLKADFVQVVKAPNSNRTRTSSGTFALSRPNRFRFDYLKPFEQIIISDGVNLWLYDKDLEQVTQRPYSTSIDSTPAALLAGGAQATLAQENFILSSLPEQDGMQWLEGKPKQDDGQINTVRIGFRQNILEVLEIVDNFGQQSTLTFSKIEVNLNVPDTLFKFEVPKGVDLISD